MTAYLPRVSLLAALAANRVIGKNNTLPWHLPEDLKRFKSLTMGHTIVMGRKTHESIGRVLPGRRNVVVSRQIDLIAPGAVVVHSLQAALEQGNSASATADELFIIGGAKLYEQTLALAQRMYLTEIQQDFEGDAYFPEFNCAEWIEVARERHMSAGTMPLAYHFVVLERKCKYAK